MDIHAPTKPIESVKEFFIHLSVVTIGILIALGLEQSVEMWHHHELAIQAQENILSEVRDNKREIDSERPRVAKNRDQGKHALEVIQQVLAHKKLSNIAITISFNGANLSSTSWTTAAGTGALGYMGYAGARKFARAYDIQVLLQNLQNDEFRAVSQAMAPLVFINGGPEQLTDDQLRSSEHDMLNCLAEMLAWDQLASQLSDEYAHVLKSQ